MLALPCAISGPLRLRPSPFEDARGALWVTFQAEAQAALGLPTAFVQENLSRSVRGALRGLHHQEAEPQGKLLRVLVGEIFDVLVDLRPRSATVGQVVCLELNDQVRESLWIPPGFAHGFYVRSAEALVDYKLTAPYRPEDERVLRWDDPELAIPWPLEGPPLLSARDQAGESLQAWRARLTARGQ